MTSFIISGTRKADGRPASVTWARDGMIGDLLTIASIEAEARRMEGCQVGPFGEPYTYENYLSDPLSAVMLIEDEQFELATSVVTSDVPARPSIPDWAIG